MARGGYRPGAGRKANPESVVDGDDTMVFLDQHFDSAKDFFMAVINEPRLDIKIRMNAATAVIPFQEERVSEKSVGKKEKRQERALESATGGKFAVPSPPKIAVDNTR